MEKSKQLLAAKKRSEADIPAEASAVPTMAEFTAKRREAEFILDPSEDWKSYTDSRLDEALKEARKSRERSYAFIRGQDPSVTDAHLEGSNWKNLRKMHTRLRKDMERRVFSAGMTAGKAALLGAGKRDLRARDVSEASEVGSSPFGDTRPRVSPDSSEEPIRPRKKRKRDSPSTSPEPEPARALVSPTSGDLLIADIHPVGRLTG